MKLSSLIVIVVLFSSSLFADGYGNQAGDWVLLPNIKISGVLFEGYELKEVTIDPSVVNDKELNNQYRIFYHFIHYERQVMVMCQVDIVYGKPNGTWCYANPQ